MSAISILYASIRGNGVSASPTHQQIVIESSFLLGPLRNSTRKNIIGLGNLFRGKLTDICELIYASNGTY